MVHVTSNCWTKFTLVRQRDCGGSWKIHSEIELNWSALYLKSDILFSPVWHVNILGVHVNSKEMSASILEDQLSVLTIRIHYFNLIGPSIAQVKLVCWKLCLILECEVSKYIPYCFNGFFLVTESREYLLVPSYTSPLGNLSPLSMRVWRFEPS